MIKITLIGFNPIGLSPEKFFSAYYEKIEGWEIDYSEATVEEKALWLGKDVLNRILRAWKNNLPVKILEREYQPDVKSGEIDLAAILEKISDALSAFEEEVKISDDERGLVITMV